MPQVSAEFLDSVAVLAGAVEDLQKAGSVRGEEKFASERISTLANTVSGMLVQHGFLDPLNKSACVTQLQNHEAALNAILHVVTHPNVKQSAEKPATVGSMGGPVKKASTGNTTSKYSEADRAFAARLDVELE